MQTSNFLAGLLGLILLGLSLALNRKAYTQMTRELVASRSLVYLAGTAALTAITGLVWIALGAILR